MPLCWTCTSSLSGPARFICSRCEPLVRETRQGFALIQREMTFDAWVNQMYLQRIQNDLVDGTARVQEQLAELTSTLTWGLDDVLWKLQEQTDLLRSIDVTLKTPNFTRAREQRETAEQLARRGVFDQAERWFLQSLDLNPLDYST